MDYSKVTSADTARFFEDGYVIKPAFLDVEETALLQRALREDEGITDERNVMMMRDRDGFATTTILWTELGDDLWGAVARCARVVDGAECVLEGEVYHYHSKLTLKAPRTGGAWNWHQDYGYWYFNGNLFPHMVSVLIALGPATRNNGCLRVLKGSQHMGRLEHMLVDGQTTADPERVDHARERLETVTCELDAGDALYLHCNTLHSSPRNDSDSSRDILLCCYNAARNNPYKEHHMPRYTPLHKLPNSAIKKRGGVYAGRERRFLHPKDIPDDQLAAEAGERGKAENA